MKSITITFKDGTKREFREQGRPGGSWTIGIVFKEGWCIVSDEWENKTAFPSDSIKEVETQTPTRW